MKIKEIRLPGQKKSRARTLLLLSGGLDSLLAGKVLEEQGVEIVGLTFESVFFDASRAVVAAEKLSWPLILAEITEEQIRIVEQPRYGYGRHLNPCIDCHGQMVKLAARLLPRYEADFISTGEVLGERPMSQNRQALELVEKSGEARGLVLRPLSARLLPPTRPEELGLVNRQQLLDLSGRCRQRQIELARYYGLTDYPAPAGGCLLTDAVFAEKLKKLRDWRGEWRREDIDLIKLGRVFFEDEGLIIVGRDEEENKKLANTALASDLLLTLPDFKGPLTVVRFKNKDKDSLVLGKFGEEKGRETVEAGQSLEIFNRPLLKKAALLTIRYSRYRQTEEAAVILVSPFRAQSRNFKKEEWKPYL